MLQRAVNRKTWRIGETLIIRHDLPGGFNYLYCPRPMGVTSSWLFEVERIAKSEGSVFLKVDPLEEFQISSLKFQVSDSIQPQKTATLDLKKPEDELFSEMHEKMRYNIRLAGRRGVLVDQDRGGVYFDRAWSILQEAAERDRFRTHNKQYYQNLLNIKSDDFYNELFVASFKNEIVSVAFVNFYRPSGTTTYLHGGLSRQQRSVMAPHLMHMYIINEAKRNGFLYYDFWGIDEVRWPGLTRFKKGFGGIIVNYPPSINIIYRSILYGLYKFTKKFRG